MNILLSCVGRRSYLVNYFKDALKGEGIVIGTNSEAFTSGMSACDKSYLVPNVDDEKYIPTLLDIALNNNVSMIVSLFDIDLPFLAQNKELFKKHNIEVIVSSEEIVDIANDKWLTYNFLKDNKLNTPQTFIDIIDVKEKIKNNKLKFPLFVKPRFGMGSIGVYKVEDLDELSFFYNYVKKQIKNSYLSKLSLSDLNSMVLIQESIAGKEFGIDIFNDLNGNYLINVCKEKLAMRSGETDSAIIIYNEKLDELSFKISKLLRHVGNLDVDVLFNGNEYYILELNARFGGGFPFSYLGGADFPKLLIDMIEKKELVLPEINFGTKCLKNIQPVIYRDTLIND